MTDQIPSATVSSPTSPRFKNHLARSMALALLFFAMIPVSIMGIVGYLQARSLLHQQTALQIYNIAHSQVTVLNDSMRTKSIRLNRVSNRPQFLDAAEDLIENNSTAYQAQLIKEFDRVNRPDGKPLFDNFFLVDSEGTIYASSENTWIGVSLAKSPYYSLLRDTDGSIGLYNLSPILPNRFAFFTIDSLSSKTGKDLGLLVGLTSGDSIRNFLNETTLFHSSSTAYIISANNSYIGIDPYTKQLAAFEPSLKQQSSIPAYAEVSTLDEDNVYSLFEFENSQNIAVVAQAHPIDSIKSNIVLEIPREVAFGQLGSLAPFSVFLVISTLLVMGTVLLFASNRIVLPLQELSKTARQFAGGNLSVRSTVERNDEIGELEYSFNLMANELSALYRSLTDQVDEQTEYIRTAAEVAQNIVSTFNLDKLLEKTARLIVERFNYYHTGIFMIDHAGKTAILRAAYGPAAKEMLSQEHHLDVGSVSIVGWVSKNNQPRAASDVGDDPVHFKNKLLPDTRAEVGIPISIGDTVLGVLDVQSSHPESFDEATITVLETLASQLATAIQNATLIESSDINLHELDRLYHASRGILQEKTAEGILQTTSRILKDSPFITIIFTPKGDGVGIFSLSDPDKDNYKFDSDIFIDTPLATIVEHIKLKENIIDLKTPTPFPDAFIAISKEIGCQAISLLPIKQEENTEALVLIGSRYKESLTPKAMQPYINLIEMVTITLEKTKILEITERQLSELGAISITNQAIATAKNMNSLCPALHEQVRQVLGNYSFTVALYNENSDTIHIPYRYHEGKISSLAPFPLGEGLTSIIIRTGQPLMIVEDSRKRSIALGAKLVGKPAKSWLGSPLQVDGNIIGAIVIQDVEKERSFDESALRFINTLASQASGAIQNIQLLESSRQKAIHLESAAEIARDISSSLRLDEVLNNAVTTIRQQFNFYYAAIFLVDSLGEYAIIREATGDAGIQLKKEQYKLRVGSKSIVGYVSKHGKALIIDNTDKDETYYANPLLPKTHAEAALPLKVGERILGVLDIQSDKQYIFTKEIIQTLSIIADQLAVAVINADFFAETQEHLSQHRLLHHITTSAASGTTIAEALRSAVQGLQVSLGGDRVVILLADKKQENLFVGASVGYSEEDEKIIIPIGSGVTGWVARNKKILRINDAPSDPRYFAVSTNTRSELAIPLIFREELLGVLNVESEDIAAYNENDEEMLGTLAGSLSAIIANARLLQQVRRQAERQRMLHEITSKIRRSTNIQTILTTTATELSKAVGAQHTQIKVAVSNNPKVENKHE